MNLLLTALVWLMVWLIIMVGINRIVRQLSKRHKSPWNARGAGIVITGASSGMGKELALLYASQGARLAISARRSTELEEVAVECRARGASVLAVTGDMSIEHDCKKLMTAAANEWNGVIDCIILNAGISMAAPFESIETKDLGVFRSIMDLNYHGVVYGCHYALPYLIKSKRSKVVGISSGMGLFGGPTRTGYSASKFALHGFFDALRCELGPKYGTEVTIICPGVVKTDINRTRVGPIAEQLDMNQSNVMPVETAGKMIVASIANGDRQLAMTPQIALGQWIRLFVPDIFDRLLINKLHDMAGVNKKKA